MRVRDVGSSVGSFFGNLLRSLFTDALLRTHSIRKMYMTEVAEALCTSEHKLRFLILSPYLSHSPSHRINTADYIIPEILAIDINAGPLLIEKIRQVTKLKSCSFVQSLWGIVSVVLHARVLGKSGGDIIPSESYLLTEPDEPNTGSLHQHHWRPLIAEEIEAVCLRLTTDWTSLPWLTLSLFPVKTLT
jgi:hypothetical protein